MLLYLWDVSIFLSMYVSNSSWKSSKPFSVDTLSFNKDGVAPMSGADPLKNFTLTWKSFLLLRRKFLRLRWPCYELQPGCCRVEPWFVPVVPVVPVSGGGIVHSSLSFSSIYISLATTCRSDAFLLISLPLEPSAITKYLVN